ncbi:hypothetical protein [Methylocella sp.]|uniref:hypothetical protein n=1 Tax=Methylocella sp. TaxID=1978226 RepID=UPI003784E830
MKGSRFTEEQIIGILCEQEAGSNTADGVGSHLARVAVDSSGGSFAQIGVETASDLVRQANRRAADEARQRGAELVGMRRLKDGRTAPNPDPDMAITDYTRDMIQETIAAGFAANEGSDAIIEALETGYAFSPERAEIIALTEVSRANGRAAVDAYRAALC